jgi:hypothetical protein
MADLFAMRVYWGNIINIPSYNMLQILCCMILLNYTANKSSFLFFNTFIVVIPLFDFLIFSLHSLCVIAAFLFYFLTGKTYGPEEFAAPHNEYITSSQDAIDATAIYDNLTSTRTDKCLSANQGRVLGERVPASPTVDGSYLLKANVSGGSVVDSWESG